jgi:hypothetical protein
MKLFDAYVYFRGRCPVGKNLEDFIRDVAGSELLNAGTHGVRDMAQALCDAEELFLPANERTLRQLQNPRYRLTLSDLPDGVTGIVSDGNTDWHTTGSKPEHLDTVYIRSLL